MQLKDLHTAGILIVDDDQSNVTLLTRCLAKFGFSRITATTHSADALALCRQHNPDLLILDLVMPAPDGYEVLTQVRGLAPEGEPVPVLVLTADASPPVKERALAAGASDFLNKPFDFPEVLPRVTNLLRIRRLSQHFEARSATLELQVELRAREVVQTRNEFVQRLAAAAHLRDDETREHNRRVGHWAGRLASACGLPEIEVRLLQAAAPLHDVGKLAIPDSILLKPGKLTPEEFAVMTTHTTKGAEILSGSDSMLMQRAEEIALTHHEHWDGGGYPRQLKGEEIPLSGRIVAIADAFDSLTHERPYERPRSPGEAVAEIRKRSGSQFDPALVTTFERLVLA